MHENRSTPLRTENRHRAIPFRRTLGVSLATLLVSTGALVCTTQPASAVVRDYIRPVSVSYTDSRTPTRNHAGHTDFPVGSWQARDGKHTARAYLTFDLSKYRGRQVISAVADTGETAVNDCGKAREIEVWRTDTPTTPPTWKKAPAAREKVADLGLDLSGCSISYLGLLVDTALQHALDNGATQVTFMFRIKGDHEGNPHYGRRLKPLGISVESNAAPDVPTDLQVLGHSCGDEIIIPTATPTLSATVTDPDSGGIYSEPATATFAYWPVDQPDERTEVTTSSRLTPATMSYTVPPGAMVHGRSYAFAVRAADRHAASAWSEVECPFTIDTERPPAPTVVSTDYPEYPIEATTGGPGIAGTFTFTSDADDLKGFYYRENGPQFFVAVEPGSRSATVSYAPIERGLATLFVRAVDRAGNPSDTTMYDFFVRQTAPRVTDANPDGRFGEPRELTFIPGMENVVEYTYRFSGGAPITVAAGPDGRATVTVIPREAGWNELFVTSRDSEGLPSGVGRYHIYLSTEPSVSSEEYPFDGSEGAPVGTPGTFVFSPGMPDVTEYVWSVAGGPEQTIPADPDGQASISYTPTVAGYHFVEVYSRTSDGVESETAYLGFTVASPTRRQG